MNAVFDLACGVLVLSAVLVVWRRELSTVVGLLALQGVALGVLVGVVAVTERSLELGAVAVGLLVLRAGVLPALVRRALAGSPEPPRETRHDVALALLAAAALALLAAVVTRPLVELAPSPRAGAIPVAVTAVLLGFLVLVSRRRALSQLAGFLVMDNGITAVGFLAGAGAGLVTELGASLDVLLAVIVLMVLTGRIRETFGDTDLDELRELRD